MLETINSCYMLKPVWIAFLSLTTKDSWLTISFPPWPVFVAKGEMGFIWKNPEDTTLTKVLGLALTVVGRLDILFPWCHTGEATQHCLGRFLPDKLTWRIMKKQTNSWTWMFRRLMVLKIYKRSRLMKNRRKEAIVLHWGTLKFHYHQRQFINPDCILDWKTVTIEAMCGTVGTIRAWTMC